MYHCYHDTDHKEFFFSGLSAENYICAVYVLILTINSEDDPSKWICYNKIPRIGVFNIQYFDKEKGKYTTIQAAGPTFIDYGDGNNSFALKINKNWNAYWDSNNYLFTVENIIENIHLTCKGKFYPQGWVKNGFVPTNSIYNADSFSTLSAKIHGNIGNAWIAGSHAFGYMESVYETNLTKEAGDFVCIYLFGKKGGLFVCGRADGALNNYARGMIINKNKTIWLTQDLYRIIPVGKKKFSKNANTSLYRTYQIKIKPLIDFNYNINLEITSLPNQKNIDFGSQIGNMSRWTQGINIIPKSNNTFKIAHLKGTLGIVIQKSNLNYTKKKNSGELYNIKKCPVGMHYHPDHELADAITGCMLDTDM